MKRWKKRLACLLAMAIVLAGMPVYALETREEEILWGYRNWPTVYDSSLEITSCSQKEGDLVIPSTISGGKVASITSIMSGLFQVGSVFASISIPDSMEAIGGIAFEGCDRMAITVDENNPVYDSRDGCNAVIKTESNALVLGSKGTVIPEGVTAIWHDAFSGCSSLESINIPEGVTSIGTEAFKNCSSLKSISIPDSVTSIGDNAFEGCSSLVTITVGENNPVYDSRGGCNAIIETESNKLVMGSKGTVIPEGVTSIGEYAFSGCSRLESINIPEGVTSIGKYAFSGCSRLESISVPGSVTDLEYGAFADCSSLKSVILQNGLVDIHGYHERERGVFSGCVSLTSISIPDSVTDIGDEAFSGCSSLESISIPASAITIGTDAFKGCNNLSGISIPAGAEYIGGGAFSGCVRLESISIPASVKGIAGSAFEGCDRLACITVDENNPVYDSRGGCNAVIKTESNELVLGCKGTVIPDSVTAIWYNAFSGCSGLESISIPASVTVIMNRAFSGCSSLSNINISDGVTNIGYDVFNDCSKLESINIPASVTSIGGSFEGCGSLSVITVDENNPVYDSRDRCNAIIDTERDELIIGCKGTVIPNSVFGIRYGAFEKCVGLKSISIPDSVASVEEDAFYNCISLERVNLPEGMTSIGDGAFAGCTSLTDVNLPASMTSIGIGAFAGCKSLTGISIPGSVECIDCRTFNGCSSLADINISRGVTCIKENAFSGCAMSGIVIPDSVTSIGAAFYRCKNLTGIVIPKSVTVFANVMVDANNALVIYCDKDSRAEAYAKKHSIKCRPIGAYVPPQKDETDLAKAVLTLEKTSYAYDGTAKTPSVTVTLDGKTLVSGADYIVAYRDNTNEGTASVTVTGKGKYKGEKTANFTITKAAGGSSGGGKTPGSGANVSERAPSATSISGKIKAKSKGFTVKWKKKKSVSGYQVQYSTSKKFTKKTTKTKTVKKASATSLTVKKLKAKRTYYVRVRTYVTKNGKKTVSKWSKVKSVRTKK